MMPSFLLWPIVLTAVLTGAEVLIGLAWISHYVPYTPPPLLQTIFLHYRTGHLPEREMQLYLAGLIAGCLVFAGLLGFLRGRNAQEWAGLLWRYSSLQAVFVSVAVFWVFVIIRTHGAPWAWHMFQGTMALSLLAKIFFPECQKLLPQCRPASVEERPLAAPAPFKKIDLILIGVIAAVIYIPDYEAVAAWLFMGDYYHNWDVIFMGAVYGLFKGLVPNIDFNATYGLGMDVLLKQGMSLLGGFDYAYPIVVLCAVGIIYYVAWFLLLRQILASRLLAFAAIVLGIRTQMFLSMVVPLVWNEMQTSVMRYFFDAGFFWCLYLCEKTQRRRYFVGMCFLSGLSMYHMPTTGIFLCATAVVFATMQMVRSSIVHKRVDWINITQWLMPLALIPACAAVFYYATVGQFMFQTVFWNNMMEWSSYFAQGIFYGPIFSAVEGGEYTKVIVGLLYPLFYLGTFLFTGYRFLYGNGKHSGFICLLAFYGMGLFTYYVGMSHKYFSVGLPAIFILFYYIDRAITVWPMVWQKRTVWVILGICLYSLLTARLFTAYPNILNKSRNPIVDSRTALRVGRDVPYFHQLSVDFPESVKLPLNSLGERDEQFKSESYFVSHAALKSYYREETAFTEDAALIARLTPADARVALLSSFEVMILSKADRKPFFYYFPLLNSHPMRMRNFVVTTIFSYTQLARCLKQLEDQKPPYVFMEKVFLTSQVPLWYGQQFEDLIALIRYVLAYYEPAEEGKYLVAMKRKP